MRAKSELVTELEKEEEKCSKRRKTEPKWSPKGVQNPLKNLQKRGPKIDAFLVQNVISPEPSDLAVVSLREGNVLRKKTKDEQSERAWKVGEVRGKGAKRSPSANTPRGAERPGADFRDFGGFWRR